MNLFNRHHGVKLGLTLCIITIIVHGACNIMPTAYGSNSSNGECITTNIVTKGKSEYKKLCYEADTERNIKEVMIEENKLSNCSYVIGNDEEVILLGGIQIMSLDGQNETADNIEEIKEKGHKDEEEAEIKREKTKEEIKEAQEKKERSEAKVMNAYGYGEFKSFMPYTKVTDKTSEQYKICSVAKPDKNGLMKYEGRYLIALGSYFTHEIGTKVDIELMSGDIIKCVVGEAKDDRHTDSTNMYQAVDKSVVEFVIDKETLNKDIRLTGTVGILDGLEGGIKNIVIYKTKVNY